MFLNLRFSVADATKEWLTVPVINSKECKAALSKAGSSGLTKQSYRLRSYREIKQLIRIKINLFLQHFAGQDQTMFTLLFLSDAD